MSLATSLKSEFLKTKRSPIWLLTLIMAAFAPAFMLVVFKEKHDGQISDQLAVIAKDPWNFYFYQGTGMISFVFLPMFIILISTLLPQIEYRNHTWKQVLASPQSFGQLYISKFLILQFFILLFIIAEGLWTGLSAVFSNMLNPRFNFYGHSLDWVKLLKMVSKVYVAILALSAMQFWLGLRFKSFLVPIGVGILFTILGLINMIGYPVLDADKFLFTFSAFITFKDNAARIPFVLWVSVAYTIGILLIGFLDFRRMRGS